MVKDKRSPIAILGAGTWGLSTALHLINAGYTNITVFDRAVTIPSQYSAGFDLNKIVRPEYEDSFYTELSLVSRNLHRCFSEAKIVIAKHRGVEDAALWAILSSNWICGSNNGARSQEGL